MDLQERDWSRIAPLIRESKQRGRRVGRPRHSPRSVLNGILWVLRSGARWKDLPGEYPSYQTCHRRFQEWQSDGTFDRIAYTLAEELLARGHLDLRECAIDGTFASAKKGARSSGRRSVAKAPRS